MHAPHRLFASLAGAVGLLAALAPAQAEPVLPSAWSVMASGEGGAQALHPADGALLVVSWEGALTALAPDTGRTLWTKPSPTDSPVDAVQVAVEGDLVVARWPGAARIEAYAVKTGEVRWTRALPSPAASLVGCTDHAAVVVTHRDGGTLVASAFAPATGEPLWRSPVFGHLAGAGAGHVFTTRSAGMGQLTDGLQALACADGAVRPINGHPLPYVGLLSASDGVVLTHHFEAGFTGSFVCTTTLDDAQTRRCDTVTAAGLPLYPVVGGLLSDGRVLIATAHAEAHNLNPKPDSWLFAQTPAGEPLWHTAPMTARMSPVAAGEQLLVAFGTTGAKDVARLLDPKTGTVLARMPLKKAPRALAADATRAYVATYEGRVAAFALPRPGVQPQAKAPVKAQAAAAQPIAAPSLGWRALTTLNAHPLKSRNAAGQMTDGMADSVAFLDAAGTTLVVGGNDDRVRVIDVASGKQRWRSKDLGKNVEAVHACSDGRFAARTYGGKAFMFGPKGTRWRRTSRFDHGNGWMSGVSPDCAYYIADVFSDEVRWHDPKTGKVRASLGTPGRMDRRGMRVRGPWLTVQQRGGLHVVDVRDLREGPSTTHQVPTAHATADGALVQAFTVNDTTLLREYCKANQCVIELVPIAGGHAQRLVFDTTGAGWSPTVPSALDISADGAWLFVFRLGLAPMLVQVATDARQPLAAITGEAPWEYAQARFSADGRRLAVGMYPKAHQVTVLTLDAAPEPAAPAKD